MQYFVNVSLVDRMFVCSSLLISVCMFIVLKALLISSAIVIVRTGRAIWLNPFRFRYYSPFVTDTFILFRLRVSHVHDSFHSFVFQS